MEEITSSRIPLLVILLINFFPFSFGGSDTYFISCGTESNVTLSGRTFVADEKPGSLTFSFSESSSPVGPSTSTSPLYQTAREFKQLSSYDFEISQGGAFMVRIHFYPFSSPDLFGARFHVSASGALLIPNFLIARNSTFPQIKEFILTVDVGWFSIFFNPEKSSFAFVNAIEVFPARDSFVPNRATYVDPTGTNAPNSGLDSKVLHVIHRINVGGALITQDNDTLWRKWLPDDDYLSTKPSARNSPVHINKPQYQDLDGYATEYTAPDYVYQTAKELNITDDRFYNFFNVTWNFPVKRNALHFVRLHFCDIISPSLNATWFNLFIYSQFVVEMNPLEKVDQLAAPYFIDFVVNSDESSYINITIGPRQDSQNQNAFLNGLEIMEFVKDHSAASIKGGLSKKVLYIIVSSVGGVVALLLLLTIILTIKYRKGNDANTTRDSASVYRWDRSWTSRLSEITSHGSPLPVNLGLKISFAEILTATSNFSPKLVISEGGFGKVYKGTIQKGMKVAVKRSEPGKGQGVPEFHTEILVLSRIRHRHLVSLIGYCDERSEMILVYEFMEKGTLRDLLYDSNQVANRKPSREGKLSWNRRLEICIGAAKGLNYLHTGSDASIIHRDVKSTNILLDQNYVAKVADFGLSRSGPLDQSHVSTDVKGSFGYVDPEYFKFLQLTQKSDVYSFGVVLLEVLCARPAIDVNLPREQASLADWGIYWQKKGQLEKIVDPFLVNQVNPNSLRKFGEIAEKCLKEHGTERPSMADVLWDLEYALLLQQTAVHREAHEDSTSDAFLHQLPVAGPLPSFSHSIDD